MIILIHIDWNRRLPFYLRLEDALSDLGHKIVFLSSSVDAWVKLKRQGKSVFLCPLGCARASTAPDLAETIEAACLRWPPSKSAKLYFGTLTTLERLHELYHLECMLLWNGGTIVGHAIRDFAARHTIATGFFEVANIDCKLFVDPEGVNARAAIAREPAILDRYPTSPAAFEIWRQRYIAQRRSVHVLPQAMDQQSFNWGAVLDLLGVLVGVPWTRTETFGAKIRRIILRRGSLSNQLAEDALGIEEAYVFLPLQLSTDTNLILNSNVDNEQALCLAAAKAHKMGCRLVVKLHPAEVDPVFVRRVTALKKTLGFLVTRANTFELMSHARLVVTINSTAGIEARLIGRPLETYGRALYSKFNDEHLRNYILGWLLDIDVNKRARILPAQAKAILERIGIGCEGSGK